MSFRAPDDSALRTVRALSREAADAELPPIEWDRVEQNLFADIAGNERPAPLEPSLPAQRAVPPAPRVGSPWTAALAAAAGIALVVGAKWSEPQFPANESKPIARATLSVDGITLGDSLKPGDVVESRSRPLAYAKRGLVSFTVAPSSRVELVSAEQIGDGPGAVTLALAEGSVHAEVEPQADGEPFAIEVDHTRVAVHGTSFTVTRAGDRVIVEVSHGSVAVGPKGHRGATQGWLVVGPDRASFSLDGAGDAEWLEHSPAKPADAIASRGDRVSARTALSADALDARRAKQSSVASAPTSARSGHVVAGRVDSALHTDEGATSEKAAPDSKTRVEQDDAVAAAILSGLEACYERQVSSFGVRFSIESSLTLSILPNGTVHEGVFNPPLSPTLMMCASEAITASRFAGAEAMRQIRVPVSLSRPE
jgi:ferric-dicitrate binding protein FerR (iron transport regulator)